jgi:hypothetical protein
MHLWIYRAALDHDMSCVAAGAAAAAGTAERVLPVCQCCCLPGARMVFEEPSSSLAHLQARQRLAWAAALHQRLGALSAAHGGRLLSAALHERVGALPPVVQPQQHSSEPQADARTSTSKGAVRGDARGLEAWHVARAALSLHSLPLCIGSGADASEAREYRRLVDRLAARMMGWHAAFSGLPASSHFFNKTSFMHEMEEVLLPLRVLVAMMRLPQNVPPPDPAPAPAPAPCDAPEPQPEPERIIVIDLCAGKGFLPMCLAHGVLAGDSDNPPAAAATTTADVVDISRVLLLEKVRKRCLFSFAFYTSSDHFTKTCSGQTYRESTQNKTVFS